MKKILAVLVTALSLGAGVAAASTTSWTTQNEPGGTTINTQDTTRTTSETTSVRTTTPTRVKTETYYIGYTGRDTVTLVCSTRTTEEIHETFNTTETTGNTDTFNDTFNDTTFTVY